MPNTGDVYHGRFIFEDGGSSMKFIVVVHSDHLTNTVLTCIVTSHSTEKNHTPGCHPMTQRFLISAGNEGFPRETFLDLLRFRQWTLSDFNQNTQDKYIEFCRTLSPTMITAIKGCYKKLKDDISVEYYPLVTK